MEISLSIPSSCTAILRYSAVQRCAALCSAVHAVVVGVGVGVGGKDTCRHCQFLPIQERSL